MHNIIWYILFAQYNSNEIWVFNKNDTARLRTSSQNNVYTKKSSIISAGVIEGIKMRNKKLTLLYFLFVSVA